MASRKLSGSPGEGRTRDQARGGGRNSARLTVKIILGATHACSSGPEKNKERTTEKYRGGQPQKLCESGVKKPGIKGRVRANLSGEKSKMVHERGTRKGKENKTTKQLREDTGEG